jgi:hypothetical protein
VKTIFGLSLVLLTLAPWSVGQDLRSRGVAPLPLEMPTPPPYCSPCLFYGGDFDATNPNANALENDLVLTFDLIPRIISIPFVVPSGRRWTVGGLFVNEISLQNFIDPAAATYSISTGVSLGNAGTVIATGTAHATYSPTGRTWSGMSEYTVQVKTKAIVLQPGTYWLSVVPRCTNQNDAQCKQAEYFASDVEDNPPPNHRGSEPGNDSFFTSPEGGLFFVPTAGENGFCSLGCNRFSAGVLGTQQKID